jgi:hypothetical protein
VESGCSFHSNQTPTKHFGRAFELQRSCILTPSPSVGPGHFQLCSQLGKDLGKTGVGLGMSFSGGKGGQQQCVCVCVCVCVQVLIHTNGEWSRPSNCPLWSTFEQKRGLPTPVSRDTIPPQFQTYTEVPRDKDHKVRPQVLDTLPLPAIEALSMVLCLYGPQFLPWLRFELGDLEGPGLY